MTPQKFCLTALLAEAGGEKVWEKLLGHTYGHDLAGTGGAEVMSS